VLKRIFGSKEEEISGGWRKLQGEELYNLFSSSNIFIVIKPRKM
jgi:hypothetical protein